MKTITFDELVEIFLSTSIHEINIEEEIPSINFNFKKDGFELFKKIVNNPISSLHCAHQEDINFLKNNCNKDCLSIEINDSFIFFKYLTDIVNETIKLFNEYDNSVNARETTVYLLRRIWLRMGINDVSNINYFLENQLQFIRNRIFDCHKLEIVNNIDGYSIYMKTKANELWDETTRSMVFSIENGEIIYELPHVLYDISNDGVCYIYGVQNHQGEKNKHIERKLYQLNKGIDNPNVHPSKVYAMLLFINELKKKGISNIIVPSMQVLSYRYHELLSNESKKNYEEIIRQCDDNPNDIYLKNRVKYLYNWYTHVYQKQDKISYLKTEELINLMYRITEHDSNIEILNEVNIQGDSMIIKLNNKQKSMVKQYN